MKDHNKIIISTITTLLALSSTQIATAAGSNSLQQKDLEKCYAIAKAEMNDCATNTQSCAGSATQDKQPDAFIFLPKGLCTRIAGGTLTIKNGNNK